MTDAVLEARALVAGYERQPVVRDLDLTVGHGEIVALLGPNGAGKTTTLLTLAGQLTPIAGQTLLLGKHCTRPLHRRSRQGLALITEERSVFAGMTVADNLRVGGGSVDAALEIFPELSDHVHRRAGLLSGGQQQMLTLARALARKPTVLLADELSLGLAPVVVERLLARVAQSAAEGVAVLLVEQHVSAVLDIAHRGYVLVNGRVTMSGSSAELASGGRLERAYLAST
ncbi:ABC transporter ATP-binding protein [Streptomyces sp. WM6386]|uniref:ABC transporter ATP-binding protein n=1 Tax=Streptomyces sp. WM6386 TaxID=1415558 RepID=UPI0006193D9E|nr:ABC transporter ATP-binding protein [Streptomyces sp. WM6386]KKD06627.1 branched-chain amino acid ABC transporter ATP-binding protein [Streptomyces sp. WM6386]